MTNKYFTMTEKELNIKSVLDRLIKKEITNKEASKLLNKTIRQIFRIKSNYIENWTNWIIHKLRWRKSNNKIDLNSNKNKKIIEIIKEKYLDFWATLAKEKLEENHKIEIKLSTLRNLMIKEWIWKIKKRKKVKKTFEFRERKESYWEMIQYDWSYHKWFEWRDNTEFQCLLVWIDDSTGKTTLKFETNEWTIPTFNFWKNYLIKYGKPKSIYLDKFSTYKINYPEAKDNKNLKTEFKRACDKLWIKLIFANTPQAKWRVERMNQTLQDRLVKELRLANISNIIDANKFIEENFIEKFNKKFEVIPKSNSNLHTPLRKDEIDNLDSIFSIHNQRKIKNDFTINFKTKIYQLYFPKWKQKPTKKKEYVLIEEHLDWKTIKIKFNDYYLEFKEIQKAEKLENLERLKEEEKRLKKEEGERLKEVKEVKEVKEEIEKENKEIKKQTYLQKTWEKYLFTKNFSFGKKRKIRKLI